MTSEDVKPLKPDVKHPATYPTPDNLKKLQKKRKKNIVVISFIIAVLIGITILESRFVDHPSLTVFALFNLNIIILILLIVLITRNLIKILVEKKRNPTGTRFRNKLLTAFIVLSMLPSFMLAVIGSNMIADSIQNWFNPQVEQSINEAMEIARDTHRKNVEYLQHFCKDFSEQLAKKKLLKPENNNLLKTILIQKRKELHIDLIQIFDQHGKEIGKSNIGTIPPNAIITSDSTAIRTLLLGSQNSYLYTNFLGVGEIIQCGFPIYASDKSQGIQGAVFFSLLLPQSLSMKMRLIKRNYDAYKQQKQAILPTQGVYISTFTLIAFTILFAAIWLGLYMARQISIPISHLAAATQEIAKGNYDFRLEVLAYDEIGNLIHSFNWMTRQLRENRDTILRTTKELQQTNLELLQQRNQLEAVLLHIDSGIILLKNDGTILMINETAKQFLRLTSENIVGKHFEKAFYMKYLETINQYIERSLVRKRKIFQKDIQIELEHQKMIFSIRFISLFSSEDNHFEGLVIVIDDLTQKLRIQKIIAWREVAKQLAHEIKNPLTPIQLNAQRLKKKYLNGSSDFPDIIVESLDMIISQVTSLRIMLNEFSKFARMPEAQKRLVNLKLLIEEVRSLYATHESVRIDLKLDPKVPELLMDPSQIRRLFINLIDNAIEAMNYKGSVKISTCFDSILNMITIEITDSGPGISSEHFNKLFLPYFSTKERGSGLGLAICSRIVSDHEGTITINNTYPHGTRVLIEIPVQTSDKKEDFLNDANCLNSR